jgi:hypothetical protein
VPAPSRADTQVCPYANLRPYHGESVKPPGLSPESGQRHNDFPKNHFCHIIRCIIQRLDGPGNHPPGRSIPVGFPVVSWVFIHSKPWGDSFLEQPQVWPLPLEIISQSLQFFGVGQWKRP